MKSYGQENYLDHYHLVKYLNASETNTVTNWICKHKAKLSRRKSLYLNKSEIKSIQKNVYEDKEVIQQFFESKATAILVEQCSILADKFGSTTIY